MNYKFLAAAAVVVALAFGAGRWTAPETVKTVERVRTVEIQKETQVVQQKIDLAELKQVLQDFRRVSAVRRETTTERRPDGTEVVREVVSDNSTTTVKTDETSSSSATTSTTETSAKETLATKDQVKTTETSRSSETWRVGLQAGLSLPGPSDLPNYLPNIPDRAVVGIYVEKRLFWKLSAGGFATSRGDVGLQLSVGF